MMQPGQNFWVHTRTEHGVSEKLPLLSQVELVFIFGKDLRGSGWELERRAQQRGNPHSSAAITNTRRLLLEAETQTRNRRQLFALGKTG